MSESFYKSNVRLLAAKNNKSLAKVARETGINPNYLSRFSTGKYKNISLLHIKKLMEYFKCSFSDLVEL